MREVAAAAGIAPALVVRYFGSKEKLFAEAVADSFDLTRNFAEADRGTLGRSFVDLLFSEQRSDDLLAMIVRAAVDPTVHPLARQLAQERMLAPMASLIGGWQPERRASLILSIVTGLWFYRFLLPVEPLAGEIDKADRQHIADMIQAIIDDER